MHNQQKQQNNHADLKQTHKKKKNMATTHLVTDFRSSVQQANTEPHVF